MSNADIKISLGDYFKDKLVNKAWLFGSFARGEENAESDVDLMVDLDRTQPVGLKFLGMWSEVERILCREVDLVTKNGLSDHARGSYNKDRILVYEAS